MSRLTDGKQDFLKALRKRGGTARIGSIAQDMEIKHSSIFYHIKPLLKNGTCEMVKRGIIKLVRDPDGPTDLGNEGGVDVSVGVKANPVEGSEEKIEAPAEEIKEEEEAEGEEEIKEKGIKQPSRIDEGVLNKEEKKKPLGIYPVEEEERKKVVLKVSSDLKPIEQEVILNITFKVKLEFN